MGLREALIYGCVVIKARNLTRLLVQLYSRNKLVEFRQKLDDIIWIEAALSKLVLPYAGKGDSSVI